jgi:hypothetical protein
MRFGISVCLALLLHTEAFISERVSQGPAPCCERQKPLVVRLSSSITASDGDKSAATSSKSINGRINGSGDATTSTSAIKSQQKRSLFRAQAGALAFKTKYGVLNPFAIWYGSVSIALGLPWYAALSLYEFFTFVTRGKFDKNRLIPNFLNQTWGTLLMLFTNSFPKVEGADILKKLYEEYVCVKGIESGEVFMYVGIV